MLILLISLVLVIIGSYMFSRKGNSGILDMALLVVVLTMWLFVSLTDPLNIDKGNLKFTVDSETKTIERLPTYVEDILGGLDTATTINDTLKSKDINIHGSFRIDEIEKTSNGYMVVFNDSRIPFGEVRITLFFFDNERNKVLSTKSKYDIVKIKSGNFNSVTVDSDDIVQTISFKECEVDIND